MNMKRLLFVFVLCMLSILSIEAAVRWSAYYDGYWGKWYTYDYWQDASYKGGYGGFICYKTYDHPSQWMWKLTINNYIPPTKKEKKEHLKKGQWYEYQGWFEYYISDECQSIKEILKRLGAGFANQVFVCPSQHQTTKGQRPCVKRTVPARIMIEPYKDVPCNYNIWFEDVGFGISDSNGFYWK